MGIRLKGKVAVITGSGQNIGRAIALLMAQEGARVVTNSRYPGNPDGTAADVAKEINEAGGTAVAVFADVSTMEGGEKIINTALDSFGTVDILVNNAAYSEPGLIWEITEQQWDRVVSICLKGHFTCTRLAAPIMRDKGSGRIINMSSRAGYYGSVGMAAYAAAKAGVVGLTWTLAQELDKYGITVNCISPVATGSNTAKAERSRQLMAAKTGSYYPASRTRLPEHIAPLVTYLACDEASKVNGQIFYASGGEIILYSHLVPAKSIYREGKWSLDELSIAFPEVFGPELPVTPIPPPPP